MPIRSLERQPADPGSRWSRAVTVLAAVVLTVAVVWIQNVPPIRAFFAEPVQESPRAERAEILPPRPGDPFHTLGRMFVKMSDMVRHDPSTMPTLDRFAKGDADRLRAAIVAGEIEGDEEAARRLAELLDRLDRHDPLAADAAALAPIYSADAGAGHEVSGDDAARLRERHGFFAEVALTHHLPREHPDRADLLTGGGKLIAVVMTAMAVGGLALLAGFVLFIVGAVQVARGRLRSSLVRPEAGGSVYLEVYVLFVAGFLLLKLSAWAVGEWAPGATWIGIAMILAQWSLLAVVLWPRLRGVSTRRLAGSMGWHAERGFWREVGFGLIGYLAGLPVYLAGLVLTILALVIATQIRGLGAGEPPVPAETIFEIIGSSPPIELFLFFSLAVIWAPLCEESVFRGALYRHLRGRWSVPLAALLSATLFGFMHGYGPMFVFPLIALGTVFAIMREWRGSLVAPITAHMLHNTTVTVLLMVMLRVLG